MLHLCIPAREEDGEPEFIRLGFRISSVTCSIACSRSIRLSRDRSGLSSIAAVPRIRSSVTAEGIVGTLLVGEGMALVKGGMVVLVPRSGWLPCNVPGMALASDGISVEGMGYVGISRPTIDRYAWLYLRFFTDTEGSEWDLNVFCIFDWFENRKNEKEKVENEI